MIKFLYLALLFLNTFFCLAQKNDITLIYSVKNIEYPVKIVLSNNIQDTIKSNIILKYKPNYLYDFVFIDSFIDNKIFVSENNKKKYYKQNLIKHLEFTDNNNNLRLFTYNPKIDEKKIVEIKTQGKINYYVVFSSADIIGSTYGYAYIEKDGKITNHKTWYNKSYFKKLQKLMKDQPDLVEKLNVEEMCDNEVLKIINEYNNRWLKSL